MNDADHDARVRLIPTADGLIVDVTTVDGREGVRRVAAPEALHDALEALLALPFEPASPPRTPEPATANTPPAAEPAGPQSAAPAPARTEEAPASPGVTFRHEIGVGLGGRVATGSRHSLSPSAYALVRADDWILGASARWDALQDDGPNDAAREYEMDAVALGFTIGRRVATSPIDLDVAFEPRLIAESQEFRPVDRKVGSTVTDFWFAGVVRAGLGHSNARPYIQADFELAPSRLRHDVRGNELLEPLPKWSLGLTAGVNWGPR